MRQDFEGHVRPGSREMKLLDHVDFDRLPRHLAVIMDGNGRWARRRRLPRVEGHRAGSKSVKETVETCARLGIRYLTLYAFSKENWKRPRAEVETLWKLLEEYLHREGKVLVENRFRLMVIGQRESIPESTRKDLERMEELTRDNDRMTILLALNYGGRAEILDAVKRICREPNLDIENLDEAAFAGHLYTAGLPDPDLLIRTSGELRISNFLLWQIAYSEIWITPVLWPDFRTRHILQAVIDYQKRERRFGDIGPVEP